jgi:hypothetical protein
MSMSGVRMYRLSILLLGTALIVGCTLHRQSEKLINIIDNNVCLVDRVKSDSLPDEYFLGWNRPNPFSPSTRRYFGIPEASQIRMVVLDVRADTVAILFDTL